MFMINRYHKRRRGWAKKSLE